MAFGGTLTDRGTSNILYSATSGDVGDTFTPSEDSIILVIGYHNNSTGNVGSCTAANWNITFSEVTGSLWTCSNRRFGCWIGRVGASPTSDRVTVNRTGMTTTSRHQVVEITGCETSGTPLSVLQQISNQVDTSSSSPITIDTISSFQTDSLLFVIGVSRITGAVWSDPSGYSSVVDDSTMKLIYKTTEDTTPNIAYTSIPNYSKVGAVAFEMLADGGGGGGSVVPRIMLQHNHFNGGVI